MGILQRLLRRHSPATETRAADPSWEALRGSPLLGHGPDRIVSNLSVAARSIALRAELLASVPLHLYRRSGEGGRERADNLPLYRVLHDLSNPQQSAFEVREFLIRSLDTAGNAFALIERDAQGQVTALWPAAPSRVIVERLESGRLRYRVSEANGGARVFTQEEVLHVRGPSRDGVLGLSPLQLSAGAMTLADKHAELTFAYADTSLRPSGLFVMKHMLSGEALTEFKNAIRNVYQKASAAGSAMVLNGDVEFKPISHSPEDSELLGHRKLSNEDVARCFGLPPTSVGITDKATYSNVEQEARALVQNALAPLARRIEAAMMRALLTDRQRRTLYVEHDLSGLLRGDVAARYQAYATGRQWGWLSPNDVRAMENLPSIDGGDEYLRPLNMGEVGAEAELEPPPRQEEG